METILIVSTALRVGFAVFAIIAAQFVLRRFDKAAGIDFTNDVWKKIATEPLALAVYHGAQFGAVAYLVGNAIG